MSLKLRRIAFEDAFQCKYCNNWFKKTFRHTEFKEYCKACIHLYGLKDIEESKNGK